MDIFELTDAIRADFVIETDGLPAASISEDEAREILRRVAMKYGLDAEDATATANSFHRVGWTVYEFQVLRKLPTWELTVTVV